MKFCLFMSVLTLALVIAGCGDDDASDNVAEDDADATRAPIDPDPQDPEGAGLLTGDDYSATLAEIGQELAADNPDCADFGLTTSFIEYFEEEIPDPCRDVLRDYASSVEELEAPEQCLPFEERLIELLRAFADDGRDALFDLIDTESSRGLTFSETGARCFTNAVPTETETPSQ